MTNSRTEQKYYQQGDLVTVLLLFFIFLFIFFSSITLLHVSGEKSAINNESHFPFNHRQIQSANKRDNPLFPLMSPCIAMVGGKKADGCTADIKAKLFLSFFNNSL